MAQLISLCFRHYDYMGKVESCIVCKQQAQKNNVIIVDNTDNDDHSLNDCKKAAVVTMMELLLLLHTPLLQKVCNLFLLI